MYFPNLLFNLYKFKYLNIFPSNRKDEEITRADYEIYTMNIEELCGTRLQEGWRLEYTREPFIDCKKLL